MTTFPEDEAGIRKLVSVRKITCLALLGLTPSFATANEGIARFRASRVVEVCLGCSPCRCQGEDGGAGGQLLGGRERTENVSLVRCLPAYVVLEPLPSRTSGCYRGRILCHPDWPTYRLLRESTPSPCLRKDSRSDRRPESLVDVMVDRLATRGGEIRTNAAVAEILLDSETRAVRGVKLKSGEEIEVKSVISTAGIDQTIKMLPGVIIPSIPTSPGPFAHSMSAFMTYVVLDQSARQLGIPPYFICMPLMNVMAVLNDFSAGVSAPFLFSIAVRRPRVAGNRKSLRTTARIREDP